MNNRKYDISETFDVFNTENVNIFKEKMLKLVFIEADNFILKESCIMTDINNEDQTYITVLNNQKVFTLLNNCVNRKNNNDKII